MNSFIQTFSFYCYCLQIRAFILASFARIYKAYLSIYYYQEFAISIPDTGSEVISFDVHIFIVGIFLQRVYLYILISSSLEKTPFSFNHVEIWMFTKLSLDWRKIKMVK